MRVFAQLDAYLARDSRAPVAVAFSGGGDSLALLLLADAWAQRARRPLVAITIDHRLQAESADWMRSCEARCASLGVAHLRRAWEGEKPSDGLAAAARRARHALLAEAARSAGAQVILMGHTADDVDEARLMRALGSSVGVPAPFAPSPVWPEGRAVFLLRPLLGERRQALRLMLAAAGESWIDDPANRDTRSLRIRARARLQGEDLPAAVPAEPRPPVPANLFSVGDYGEIALDRKALAVADPRVRRRLLGAALLCASGQERPPLRSRLDRLADRLCEEDAAIATLAGARAEIDGPEIRLCRNAGLTPASVVSLSARRSRVWDGRFELTAPRTGLAATAVAGRASRLPRVDRDRLRRLPPAIRPTLPAYIDRAGVAPPRLAPVESARPLAAERLRAALGHIDREALIGRVAERCDNA